MRSKRQNGRRKEVNRSRQQSGDDKDAQLRNQYPAQIPLISSSFLLSRRLKKKKKDNKFNAKFRPPRSLVFSVTVLVHVNSSPLNKGQTGDEW